MEPVTLDDTSPYIRYDETWTAALSTSITGGPQMDLGQGEYQNLTWHHTASDGAKAEISWYGGDITIYGAYRTNHAWYAVSLDGRPKDYRYGYAKPDIFRAPIYQSSNLIRGPHTVALTNEPLYNNTGNYLWSRLCPPRHLLERILTIDVDIDYITLYGEPILPDSANQTHTAQPPAVAADTASSVITSSTTSVSSSLDSSITSSASSSSIGLSASPPTTDLSPHTSPAPVPQPQKAGAMPDFAAVQFGASPHLHPPISSGLVAQSVGLENGVSRSLAQTGVIGIIGVAWLIMLLI